MRQHYYCNCKYHCNIIYYKISWEVSYLNWVILVLIIPKIKSEHIGRGRPSSNSSQRPSFEDLFGLFVQPQYWIFCNSQKTGDETIFPFHFFLQDMIWYDMIYISNSKSVVTTQHCMTNRRGVCIKRGELKNGYFQIITTTLREEKKIVKWGSTDKMCDDNLR